MRVENKHTRGWVPQTELRKGSSSRLRSENVEKKKKKLIIFVANFSTRL